MIKSTEIQRSYPLDHGGRQNADLCFNKSTGSSKESYIAYVVCHELCFGKCWKLMTMLHLLKIRMCIDILSTLKCKSTFGLTYRMLRFHME